MKYYVLFNKDGQELPLGPLYEEEHAKGVLNLDPRVVREIIPSYGTGFHGDLVAVRYEEEEESGVRGKVVKEAFYKVLKERDAATKRRMIMEGRYENMTNKVDEWGKRIAGLVIFVIAAVLALYGGYFLLMKVLPALITWIVVGSLALIATYFPLAYVIGYLATKYDEEEVEGGDGTSLERELVEDLQRGRLEADAKKVPKETKSALFHGINLREIFSMEKDDFVFRRPFNLNRSLVFNLAMKATFPKYNEKKSKSGIFCCPSCGKVGPLKYSWVSRTGTEEVKCGECGSKYRISGDNFDFDSGITPKFFEEARYLRRKAVRAYNEGIEIAGIANEH